MQTLEKALLDLVAARRRRDRDRCRRRPQPPRFPRRARPRAQAAGGSRRAEAARAGGGRRAPPAERAGSSGLRLVGLHERRSGRLRVRSGACRRELPERRRRAAAARPLGRRRRGSACMHCGTEIRARDNIPVLSYLLLRGRCRSCRAPIGLRYPAVELATARARRRLRDRVRPDARTRSPPALFCAALVAISATDIEHRIVPNRVVLPAAVVVLALQLAWHPTSQWPAAGSAPRSSSSSSRSRIRAGWGWATSSSLSCSASVSAGPCRSRCFVGMLVGARAVGRALRAPRGGGAEDEDPVRAVPRARRRRRPVCGHAICSTGTCVL